MIDEGLDRMTIPTRLASLGEVMQIAFIPKDFDATLDFWVNVMGAGPFYLIKGSRAEKATHRGRPSDPMLDIALGHWGDMQIEIIRQTNDAPSPYKEWRDAGGEGIHHVCIVVDDIERAKQISQEAGLDVMLNGEANGAEWIYVDTGGGPGTVIEMVRHSQQSQGMMDLIRDAARGWNGEDPVRVINLG